MESWVAFSGNRNFRALMHQGQLQDETFFGRIHFDRKNQNIGRLPITWQVLEDGNDRPGLGVCLKAVIKYC